MQLISSSPTLKTLQETYVQNQDRFRRQSVISSPGLGKNVLAETLEQIEIDAQQYIFSTELRNFKKRNPEAAKEIDMAIAQGGFASPERVAQVYRDDLTTTGFDIEEKLKNGTVLYDGFPRMGGLNNPNNQIEILKQCHTKGDTTIFGLVTIMRHTNSYEPAMRQIMRELRHEYKKGTIDRKDALFAAQRVAAYNQLLPDLENDIRHVAKKTIAFEGDNNTPQQRAFLYLGLSVTELPEDELRNTPEYTRLGASEYQFPSHFVTLDSLKKKNTISDSIVAANAADLEKLLIRTHRAQENGEDFNKFANYSTK